MRNVSPVALLAGLLAVAGIVGGVLFMQRGAHLELKGAILKVRTHPLDEASSLAVVDFRFANDSNYPFVVKEVRVSIVDAAGQPLEGAIVAEMDAERIFKYYPQIGQKFNASLTPRTKIAGRSTEDRMISARFEIPEEKLVARKSLTVRIEDVDGPVSELKIP